MWGSVETTVKLAFTGLAGFTLACVVIETAGTAVGKTVAGSSESQNYFVTRTLVELLLAVWKSRHYAFVLNRRVVLHAIDAMPAISTQVISAVRRRLCDGADTYAP